VKPDDADAWFNTQGEMVHPNAPRGGSGPGVSRFPGSYGANPSANVYGVPNPGSPSARYLALNDADDTVVAAADEESSSDSGVSDEELGKMVGDAAEKAVGKPTVGKNKSCWDLAEKVLSKSGGKGSNDFETVTGKDDQDYKWGKLVDDPKEIRRGDIVQFRDHEQKVTKTRVNGSSEERTAKRGHHTAIVLGVNPDGSIDVSEQHLTDFKAHKLFKTVQRGTIYRESHRTENPDGSTTDVKVSGDLWFYHPVVDKKAKRPKHPR
jgi:hypothetical protein